MIDIAPILAFLALIVGPVLAARLVTRGEPVDLSGVVATLLDSSTENGIHGTEAQRWRRDPVGRRLPAALPGDADGRRRHDADPRPGFEAPACRPC